MTWRWSGISGRPGRPGRPGPPGSPGPLGRSPIESENDPFAENVKVRRMYDEAERILEEATSPERLKTNPFVGKPLPLEANPYDRGYGMAFRMLKSGGFKLPWMEMKDEIIAEKRAVKEAVQHHVEWLEERTQLFQRLGKVGLSVAQNINDEHERFMAHLTGRIEDLRKKIAQYNLEVPIMEQQMVNVTIESFTTPYTGRIERVLRLAASIAGGQ